MSCTSTDLHHVFRLVDCPHHDLLACCLALITESGSDVYIRKWGFRPEGHTYFDPSALIRDAKAIEKTSTSFQKYLRANAVDTPMCERRQYGNLVLAGAINKGCHSPSKIRGASFVSQSGTAEIRSCMRENKRSGSFWTLTSTLNLTCWFSG